MADNKKYYYLRLKENFFEDEAIIILESMPDGYIYCNILLKLYLRSLKNDGRLMYREFIPYTPEVIAQVTRHSVGDIKAAIEVFEKLGLVEVLDNGAIYMLDIQELVGNSSTEADRKRRYRAQIEAEKVATKSLENGTNVRTDVGTKLGQMSGHTGTRDRDRDRDRDRKEIEEVENRKISSATADKSDFNIFDYYQNRIGLLDGFQLQQIEAYQAIDGLEPDLIKIAIDKAADNSKRSFGYVNSILKSWAQNGIKTVAQQREEQNSFQSNKPNSDKPKFGPACSKY